MMAAPAATDHVVPTLYSGAIEEGFRRLSTSQQNTIAIKVILKIINVGPALCGLHKV